MTVLEKEYIFVNEQLKTRDEVFSFLAKKCVELDISDAVEKVIAGLEARESESSTCFGDEIALPHCRVKEIKKASILIIKNETAIEWDTSNLASIIIMLAIPDDESDTHIKVLSSIARKLVKETFVEALKMTNNTDDIYRLFTENAA